MFSNTTLVLIVDDMRTMRTALKEQLKSLGFSKFIECQDGEEAFAKIGEQVQKNEPIQLVLSDWCMPLLTGLDLVKKIRATESIKDLPVLLVTAEKSADNQKQALAAGASGFLMKPFTVAELREKVLGVWDHHKAA